MRYITRALFLFFMTFSLISCTEAIKQEELPSFIVLGGAYYTQIVIHDDKGAYPTTNYQRGFAIPVNTPINLLSITSKTITVTLANTSQQLIVKNIEKHTGDDIYHAFNKLFAKKKVNLSKFTPLEINHIESGTVANGMRKEAVIIAIGYPPITETFSQVSNQWVYWTSRFNRFKVNFENGKVSKIVD
jgi:hypothetical protein